MIATRYKEHNAADWSPASWREKPVLQDVHYADTPALQRTEETLANLPPLVFTTETERLHNALAAVAAGRGFLLQGGDCAESFAEFNSAKIQDTFHVLLKMADILSVGGQTPVVKIGRIAGQFAKPRSEDTETRGGVTLPSYRGDNINGYDFTPEQRTPDPARMIRAYHQSAAALNLLRALAYDFDASPPAGNTSGTDFYTSHESLLLPYEQAMTRRDGPEGQWYDTSAHFLWVGARTCFEDHAHIEFLRGIQNPLGIKCAPDMTADRLMRLLDILNPENKAGRITLIIRMGHERIGILLPPLIRAVRSSGHNVIWSCDPMHGNTVKLASGRKTRVFGDILSEVQGFFAVHRMEGTHPGGIHIEMTGQDVTECTGGLQDSSDSDLTSRYHTQCDPRLNADQSLALASLLADEMRADHTT